MKLVVVFENFGRDDDPVIGPLDIRELTAPQFDTSRCFNPRKMIIEISDEDISALFRTPEVKAKVVKSE